MSVTYLQKASFCFELFEQEQDTETQLLIFMQKKIFFKKVIGGGFGDLNEWEKTNVSKPFKVTFFQNQV